VSQFTSGSVEVVLTERGQTVVRWPQIRCAPWQTPMGVRSNGARGDEGSDGGSVPVASGVNKGPKWRSSWRFLCAKTEGEVGE
jgi:hypothetical protein